MVDLAVLRPGLFFLGVFLWTAVGLTESPLRVDCGPGCLGASVLAGDPLDTASIGSNTAMVKGLDRPDLDGLQIPVVLNASVMHYIDFFNGRGRRIFAGWYARMGAYAPMIESVLKREGLPPELVYVCMIESGFSVDAVSRAGAVGPWQFMLTTGRAEGLRHDDWVDERRDPIKATEAAAKHFKALYARFRSWPLVLAAYNAGAGRVSGAIRRNGTTDFWRLSALGALPKQATHYVPKAMAAMVVGHNIDRYGFSDVVQRSPAEFDQVAVPGGTDVFALAKKVGMKMHSMNELNPELRRGFTPPYGQDYALRVPKSKAKRIRDIVLKGAMKAPRVFQNYRVRFGERLKDIALRHGVSRTVLAAYNDMRGEPKAGTEIIVPKVSGARRGRSKLTVLQDPGLQFKYPDRQTVYFPVRYTMSVESVADFFSVSPGEIGLWNGLDPDLPLHKGMALRLFIRTDFPKHTARLLPESETTKVIAGTPGAQSALRFARSRSSEARRIIEHRVKRGDNVWKLSKRYRVNMDSLKAVNGWSKLPRLSPGRVVRIPLTHSPKPKGKARKRSPKKEARGREYTVRRGDSLWKIARRFGVTVKEIKRRNRMGRRSRLKAGQVILIPSS